MSLKRTKTDNTEPCDNGQNMPMVVKSVPSCCCAWGLVCKNVRMKIESLPDGSNYNLWKQPYAQIITGNTEKKKKLEQVIRRHLGVEGDPPD